MFNNDVFIDDSLERYIGLYEKGTDIKTGMSPLSNETYRILVKSNTSIRLINIRENYDFFTRSGKAKHFINCVRKMDLYRAKKYNIEVKNSYVYMIPVQTLKGTIVGFLFRGLFGRISKNDPKYHTTTSEETDKIKKVPYMYGYYKDFDDFDNHPECPPVIVTEGVKDCIYLKQFYPYVLSTNTNKLGFNANIIRNFTNKIIVIFDNDEGGEKVDEIRNLTNLKFNVSKVRLDEGVKDPTSYLLEENRHLEQGFVKRIKAAIRDLNNY